MGRDVVRRRVGAVYIRGVPVIDPLQVAQTALTWAALTLLAWRVARLERRGATVRALLARKAARRVAPPAPPPAAFAPKRTWGDPPPLPEAPPAPNPAAYISGVRPAVRADAVEPVLCALPPVPTDQVYRARTRVWRRDVGGGRSE